MAGNLATAKKLAERKSSSRMGVFVVMLAASMTASTVLWARLERSTTTEPFTLLKKPGTLVKKCAMVKPTQVCTGSMS